MQKESSKFLSRGLKIIRGGKTEFLIQLLPQNNFRLSQTSITSGISPFSIIITDTADSLSRFLSIFSPFYVHIQTI